jgi:hypothetical protein
MIRPLREINEEFFAEIADAASPPQDVPPSVDEDDAEDLPLPFEGEAEEKPKRSLPRHALPIAIAVVAIILLIIAAILNLKGAPSSGAEAREGVSGGAGSPPSGADVSGGAGESGEAAESGGNAEAGVEAAPVPELDEGAYDSARESVEAEIDAAREAGEGADAAANESVASLAEIEIAALYLYILGPGRVEDADLNAEPDADPSRASHLADRISARISEMASADAAPLPPDDAINSDSEFTSLTKRANALINAINAGREAKSRLPEVIDFRERAYAIYPVRVLKKLLASDYGYLGSHYAPDNASEAFDAFVYAIKYRMEYLNELPYAGDAQREELGRVAGIYAKMAEIEGLDAALKRHAAFISDC